VCVCVCVCVCGWVGGWVGGSVDEDVRIQQIAKHKHKNTKLLKSEM
jgi:hypothetical protein